MPNGGYPLHFLAPIPGTDLALHAGGTDVELLQYTPAEPGSTARPRPASLGSLSREQIGALTHHLLYWSGPLTADLRAALSGGRLPIRPQFHARGCLYDY